MDEAALLKRLGITEGPIIAFNVKGGVKEFLRHRLQEHGAMNICGAGPDGKAERYHQVFERLYGETLEGKKKRKVKK